MTLVAALGILGVGLVSGSVAAQAVVSDPTVSTVAGGVTSVAPTQGKAQGSGLWGYVGDVETRVGTESNVYTYDLAFSPVDGSMWVTDSAKIYYTSSAYVCTFLGGTLHGGSCYVGDSKVMKYELASTDWSLGEYAGDGTWNPAAVGANDGVGVNYQSRADATVLDGATSTNGEFGGARGITIDNNGLAWVIDSNATESFLTNTGQYLRTFNPDTSEGATSYGDPAMTNIWGNRHNPDAKTWAVGVTTLENGNVVTTDETTQLLREFAPDGTFVRNIYLEQTPDAAYVGDLKFRSPYAVAADPSTTANDVLVGYIDPGAGNDSYIERIDLDSCTTEAVGSPAGSSIDRCTVSPLRIGIGALDQGNGVSSTSPANTFAIAVDPVSTDIYVGQRGGELDVFAQDGTHRGKFSAYGTGNLNGQVRSVRGIDFDSRGFMYLTVAEGTSSTRVMIFARTPDPVTNVVAWYDDASRTSGTVMWDALATGVTSDAQAPVRDYVIETSIDGGTTWNVMPSSFDTNNTATFTGLDPAETYEIRVTAWNEAGNGSYATPTNFLAEAPAGGLVITKTGDGQAAPSLAERSIVEADSEVTFEYTITNNGSGAVNDIVLTDDQLGTITEVVSPTGFAGTLAPGESVVFRATGVVPLGDYVNVATVRGTTLGSMEVEASTAWYAAGIEVLPTDPEKETTKEATKEAAGPAGLSATGGSDNLFFGGALALLLAVGGVTIALRARRS